MPAGRSASSWAHVRWVTRDDLIGSYVRFRFPNAAAIVALARRFNVTLAIASLMISRSDALAFWRRRVKFTSASKNLLTMSRCASRYRFVVTSCVVTKRPLGQRDL